MTETQSFATETLREIFSQPQTWQQAINQAAAGTALPEAGTPVLFIGCGTSYYVGEAYARLRNQLGLGRTRAVVPSEIPYIEDDETVIVLSRSGTTTDVIDAARNLKATHQVIGLVGTPESPLIDACTEVVMLDYADEVSIVQTRFASTAFTLLRASLVPDLGHLVTEAEQALTRTLPTPAPEHVVFLGTGFSLGLAHEAALKCLESSGRWAEAYAVMEYQHGPISAAGPGTIVWPLVPLDAAIADAIRQTGATVVDPEWDPQAELVAIHRMAVAMAKAAGRNPDVPPFLSRSVQIG
ncbi:hypothetical protein AL755_03750 (plasmid) [Arthrobacter sp. ERGS1:01]|uniref:SIS domain-containing protein n=1 Tax=Arthrobacter sp. ERGS1:01 TaxID=1704044 RepID=UPI0006B49DA3|nr:SIS domain-containing protein [Arthrobacter sp. ERGS1:01]ALE04807.1 hypothetical protein AL755_03750 [Arthrobacter sp. ERGS1:01]